MALMPDKWLIVKISPDTGEKPHYRVFGTWSGGYLSGDSWRMNSGIVKCEENEDETWIFYGNSTSIYYCGKESYGSTVYGCQVLETYKESLGDQLEIMEDRDWFKFFEEVLNES